MPRPHLTRRRALTLIAVTATGALIPRRILAQDGYLLPDTDVCAVMPETTEGPYYLDERLFRQDIRDGRDGAPVMLRLQVVDAACLPIANARVDVWHCDAQGVYSQFGGGDAGQTSDGDEFFLRGAQMTDARGVALFQTIYPGWYAGRTTHIHYKVWLGETQILTGQIFFPDALSEYIYQNAAPYARDRARDTLNAGDGIAIGATRAAFAGVTEEEDNYLVQLIIGVAPDAVSTGRDMMGGPGDAAAPPAGDPPPDGGPGGPGGPGGGERDPEASLIPGLG